MFLFKAAAALLFSQLLYNGVSVEIDPDQLLAAAVSEFTDLAQVTENRNPFVHLSCRSVGLYIGQAVGLPAIHSANLTGNCRSMYFVYFM